MVMDCISPKRGRKDWRFEVGCVLDGGSLRFGGERGVDFVFLGLALGGGAAFRLDFAGPVCCCSECFFKALAVRAGSQIPCLLYPAKKQSMRGLGAR